MSKGKRQRKAIDAGLDQANQATERGVNAFSPYAAGGSAAFGNANAFLGLDTPEKVAAARALFEGSPFYAAAQNAFGLEKDYIDSGLSKDGLLYSSARIGAVEDARQRQYGNALDRYIALNQSQAGAGFGAASGQAGLYGQQGQNALAAAMGKVGTYKGIGQKIGDAFGAVQNIASLANFGAGLVSGGGAAPAGAWSSVGHYSDRRLKTDISAVSNCGPLVFYKWRWNDQAEALGLSGAAAGFMADEVAEFLPEAVRLSHGYQFVDYKMIAERLEQ